MKKLSILILLSFSLSSIYAQAGENNQAVQPTYNSGSEWWVEVTPNDPDYELYKGVAVNCFCD